MLTADDPRFTFHRLPTQSEVRSAAAVASPTANRVVGIAVAAAVSRRSNRASREAGRRPAVLNRYITGMTPPTRSAATHGAAI